MIPGNALEGALNDSRQKQVVAGCIGFQFFPEVVRYGSDQVYGLGCVRLEGRYVSLKKQAKLSVQQGLDSWFGAMCMHKRHKCSQIPAWERLFIDGVEYIVPLKGLGIL